MNKHDPMNKECPKTDCDRRGHIDCYSCRCPAQLEESPAQKEEWDDDYEIERNKFTQYDTSLHGYVLNDSALKAFIASQISQAEARGREKQKMDCETGHMVDDYAEHLRDLEEARLSTITAFEEEIARLKKECTDAKPADEIEKVDERAYLAGLTDLLKFASSLKSNAPKV